MVDTEVENVLREIRERVRGQSLARLTGEASTVAWDVAEPPSGEASPSSSLPDTGALARLEANLATTERAWNKLPPLASYRSGWLARLELWLKRQVKRATHWFTWEQVNFNSATHHALRDALAALSVYEQHIAALHREIAALQRETTALRPLKAEFEARHAGLEAQLAERALQQAATFETRLAALTAHFDSVNAELRTALTETVEQSRREQEGAHSTQVMQATQTAQLEQALQRELRERIEQVQNEQRVCFKQLALESSETAVLADRARRGVETRINELAARVEEMRAEKKREEAE